MTISKHALLFCVVITVTIVGYSQPATDANIGGLQMGKNFNSLVDIKPKYSASDSKGTRYLPGNWTKGVIIDLHMKTIINPSYLFIYDKLEQKLYLKYPEGKDTVLVQLDNSQLSGFKILVMDSVWHKFYKHPVLSNTVKRRWYYEKLFEDSALTLYKHIETRFLRADISTLHRAELKDEKANEFVDEIIYYVVYKNNNYEQVKLTRKSVSTVFGKEKVSAYARHHELPKSFTESGLIEFLKTL